MAKMTEVPIDKIYNCPKCKSGKTKIIKNLSYGYEKYRMKCTKCRHLFTINIF